MDQSDFFLHEPKILMLGHSGVGKTTYMASMYGALQQHVNGFTLRADTRQDHRGLLRVCVGIQNGNWPAPTDRRQQYRFFLRYDREPVMPFVWTDYRGGALLERADSPGARLLLNDLEEADAIIMYCDAPTILAERRRAEIGRMTQLVTHAVSRKDVNIPLAIVYTKCDLVDQTERTEEKLIAPVKGLVEAIKASRWVMGSIIPVACGRNPLNVQLPVLFTLHHEINWLGVNLESSIDALVDRIVELEKQGPISRIWENYRRWRKYKPFVGQEEAIAKALLEQMINAIKPLVEPADQLGRYLDGLITF